MKKLILSVLLMAFAVAAQAGDTKACTAEGKTSCCSKAQSTEQTKATPCCSSTTKVASKRAPVRQVLLSPKAMSLASK